MTIFKQKPNECYICHRYCTNLHKHHIYEGAFRQRSELYGMTVLLCPDCHTGDNGVHLHEALNKALKAHGQKKAMAFYKWSEEEFISHFGQNYLRKEEIKNGKS